MEDDEDPQDHQRETVSNGSLIWQNRLGQANQAFFKACHGMLTNYSWVDDSLKDDHDRSKERNFDIYKGSVRY